MIVFVFSFSTFGKSKCSLYPLDSFLKSTLFRCCSSTCSIQKKNEPCRNLNREMVYFRGHWKNASDRKRFFISIAEHFDLKTMDDWYNVKGHNIDQRFLQHFSGSLIRALETMFPLYSWKIWKFLKVPKGYWNDVSNQRKLLDAFAMDSKFQSMNDWYDVTSQEVIRKIGDTMIQECYGGSLIRALQAIYPTHEWKIWRFIELPKKYWSCSKNVEAYLKWLSVELGIIRMEDWHNVTSSQIYHLKGEVVCKKYGGLFSLLSFYFPSLLLKKYQVPRKPSTRLLDEEDNTQISVKIGSCVLESESIGNGYLSASCTVSKIQLFLYNIVHLLFPDMIILLDYKLWNSYPLSFSSRKQSSQDNSQLALDIFVPALSLALEFHGRQHYCWSYKYGSPERRQQRDQRKTELCDRYGITIVIVPFWWDCKKETISMGIELQRPDIFHSARFSINDAIPKAFSRAEPFQNPFSWSTSRFPGRKVCLSSTAAEVSNGGLAKLPCFHIQQALSEISTTKDSLKDWWMCRRGLITESLLGNNNFHFYDRGIRVLWNGRGKFFRENGQELWVPPKFSKLFPIGMPLDGELISISAYQNRNAREILLEARPNQSDSHYTDLWLRNVRFQVFDVVHSQLPFEKRIELLYEWINAKRIDDDDTRRSPFIIEFWKCRPLTRSDTQTMSCLLDIKEERERQSKMVSERGILFGRGKTTEEIPSTFVLRKSSSFYYELLSFLQINL